MSTPSLTRVASNTAAAATSLTRAAGSFAGRHSRMSMIAASAAAAGVLGASGFAVGAAPWAQAFGNVAHTAQGDGAATTGAFSFGTITGTKTASGTTELDALHSAAISSHTTATALSRHSAATAATQATLAKPAAANPAAAKAAAVKVAAAKTAAAKAAAAKTTAAKAATARAVAARAKAAAVKLAAAKAAAAKPYTIYDSVEPGRIPSGAAAAVYATGSYATQPSSVAGHRSVLWIDTNGSDTGANVLDVEPGDATPAGAAHWVEQKLTANRHSVAIVYTMKSDWQQVKANVAALPEWMHSKVRYWIADPTGVNHVVPGSSATQWYWGSHYDITTANPEFTK
jgi:ABC-2 type transport system ATP-binding protein